MTDEGPMTVPSALAFGDSSDRRLAPAVGRLAPGLLVLVLSGAVAATFAPWLRTGSTRRTSYEVVRAADRLQVLDAGAQAAVSVLWAFLPFFSVLAVAAVVAHRIRLAAALAALVGVLEVALASAVKIAPRSADWGTTAGFVLGITVVVVALTTAVLPRSTPWMT